MKYTLSELKREVFKDVYRVYGIFQDYFGENFVDLQLKNRADDSPFQDTQLISNIEDEESLNEIDLTETELSQVKAIGESCIPYIYVWWPTVTVTNENDKSVVIKDLYARIIIDINGTIPFDKPGFTLLRATYPYEQFMRGYVHSHVPVMYNNENDIKQWRDFCLGRSSFRDTILDLRSNSDDATWMLFCQELSLCVTIESLTGGPYTRLEEITTGNLLERYNGYRFEENSLNSILYSSSLSSTITLNIIKAFIPYYLENEHLSFNYKGNGFYPGMPFFDFIIDISNCFINWYNQNQQILSKGNLFSSYFLIRATTSNRKIYNNSNNNTSTEYYRFQGMSLLTFKNQDIKLHIEQNRNDSSSRNEVVLLNEKVASYILERIIKTINYKYENKYNKLNRGTCETSTTYKKVCII